MKVSKWAILLAMAGGLSAATAFGQSGLRQPGQVAPAGFEYGSFDYYAAQEPAPSPSDAPAPPPAPNGNADMPMDAPAMGAPAVAGACDTCGAGGDCGCEECKLECPEACEPWKLFDCDHLKCHNMTAGGWIEAGFTANFDDPADRWNGPVGYNDRDEFQMNQSVFYLERALDTECGWDWGGRIDMLYGTDGRWIGSAGLEMENPPLTSKWNNERFYHTALPQAYLDVGSGDWKLRVGKFVTLLEYEVIAAPSNFFYSHSYGFLYAVPFTHTGALAFYTPNDQLTLIGGIHRGWERWEDDNDSEAFLGGATFTSSDKNSSLAVALTTGDEFAPVTGIDDNRTAYSLAYSRVMTDRLSWVLVHDGGWQDSGADGGANTAEWYTLTNYFFYKVNCCWTGGFRFDYMRDDDGTRVFAVGDGFTEPVNTNRASAGGFEGDFWAVTAGLNYKPTWNPNLAVRPEIRYDWFDGRTGAVQPYDDGTDDSQFLAAIDVIFTY
jgi:hypothetical protein